MTSTDLVLADDRTPTTFDMLGPAAELAGQIARTEFVPGALRNKADAITACVLYGHELGIPPMQALAKIHVIDGRPAMAAELMRATVLRAGHRIWVEEATSTRVTVCAHRTDWPDDQVAKVTWTMDDAKRAGLDSKQNWRKYPRAMLTARASSEMCRLNFPDVLGGISYSLEELEDGDVIDAELVDESGDQPTPTQTRTGPAPRKAPAKKAAARKAAAPKPAPAPLAPEDAPPLPGEDGFDDVVDAVIVDDTPAEPAGGAEEKPLEVRRAQMLVIKAGEAGLDDEARHGIVRQVTGGRTQSTKDVTSTETDLLVQIFERVAAGEDLDEVIADVLGADPIDEPDPEPAPEPPAGDGGRPGDVDGWRDAMKAAGIRNAQVLRWASEDAGALNREPPTNLAALLEDGELADLVWMRITDRSDT